MEASSNLSSSEARWTGNQPAASHSPSVLTCDQCLMKRLKRESTHDLHVQHNVADLILQVALRNSLTSKLPEQNNRMLHQSIFLRRAKSVALVWRVCQNQSHCPARLSHTLFLRGQRASCCRQSQALGGLEDQRGVPSTPLRSSNPWRPHRKFEAVTPPTKHTNVSASMRTPICIFKED